MATKTKLPRAFYARSDVLKISRELLGMVLCTEFDGEITKAMITETEAYAGETDKASHDYAGRRTKRTEPIYGDAGHAYVYLCYGIHHLFNVVTNKPGTPHAVLVRAGFPLDGEQTMLRRRNKNTADKALLGGPGSFGQALGITTKTTGADLQGPTIWIEDHAIRLANKLIDVGPRVGVDYAEEDAALPYRFSVKYQTMQELICS